MTKAKSKSNIISLLGFGLLLIIIFLFFRYAIEITIVSGESMNPTIEDGDVLLTSKLLFSEKRGSVVLFNHDDGFQVVKRIIGLPGETIAITDGTVYINHTSFKEDYIKGVSGDYPETIIPEGHYFLVGDNREPGESLDSRSSRIGMISEQELTGKVSFSVLPVGSVKK